MLIIADLLLSILAGMMIALGCILYINIGGALGAFCFAIGLMSVVLYKFKLFTGKAGLLATKEIKVRDLIIIWIGNLIGAICMGLICICLPNFSAIEDQCITIMQSRESVGFIGSFVLAIPCGMLMYMAVSTSEQVPMRLFYICMCVLAFIMGGFYHCIADMFYTVMGAMTAHQYFNFLFVTAGNIFGCNVVPLVNKLYRIAQTENY